MEKPFQSSIRKYKFEDGRGGFVVRIGFSLQELLDRRPDLYKLRLFSITKAVFPGPISNVGTYSHARYKNE